MSDPLARWICEAMNWGGTLPWDKASKETKAFYEGVAAEVRAKMAKAEGRKRKPEMVLEKA